MRYQNWDVLVFPDESKIPLQEFRTSCHVMQDQESRIQAPVPIVTSFIPSLPPGAAFRVSIHSWQEPDMSNPLDQSNMFQARLLVDGVIVGTQSFDHEGPWPSIIEHSIEPSKKSESETLHFPTFHRELLSQSYWNAGDDLGRVKLIIAEGASREGIAFETVRDIVCFSFQHAPLEVLEASAIAWPNPAMWRQVPVFSYQFPSDMENRGYLHQSTAPKVPTSFHKESTYDPFTEPSR